MSHVDFRKRMERPMQKETSSAKAKSDLVALDTRPIVPTDPVQHMASNIALVETGSSIRKEIKPLAFKRIKIGLRSRFDGWRSVRGRAHLGDVVRDGLWREIPVKAI